VSHCATSGSGGTTCRAGQTISQVDPKTASS
jgi:hypothetical protein